MAEEKIVSIVAKGESRVDCPFEGETWGLNDVMELPECKGKKVSLLFTFDPRTPEYLAAMRKHAPVVSWRDYADIKYPTEEIIAEFTKGCVPGDEYFTNTISYMIAYAIKNKYTEIRLYGVDAPFGGIYWMEKPGIEFWAGVAAARGVKIVPTPGSYVLCTKDGLRYGDRSDKQTLKLYLFERQILLNILPRKGRHIDTHNILIVRNQLLAKDDEAKEHRVSMELSPDGSVSYKLGKDEKGNQEIEYSKAIWMPSWTWRYLSDILISLESQGKLPVMASSLYEKIVLNGNADLFEPPLAKGKVKVSYVLTTKNRANFLHTTLTNIVTSGLVTKNDELIIVDGGSTDQTPYVLEQFKHYITQVISETDLSGSHALNKGILAARGEYVKHLPDDDVIFPEGIRAAVAYMDKHHDVDLLVCGGVKRFGNQDARIEAPETYGQSYEDVFKYGACGTGFFHRRASFSHTGLFHPTHIIADQEYALRVVKTGKVRFLNCNMYLHPIFKHSLLAQRDGRIQEAHNAMMKEYCPQLLKQPVLVGGSA